MKKMTLLTLAMAAALSLTACGQSAGQAGTTGGQAGETTSSEAASTDTESQSGSGEGKNGDAQASETPESVTVTTLNGNGEKVELRFPIIRSALPFWIWRCLI